MQILRSNAPYFHTETLLFRIIGADMNSTADQAFVKLLPFTNYFLRVWRINNASTSLTTAAGGIYTAEAKGGVQLLASSQTYAALTTSAAGLYAGPPGAGSGIRTETPFLSLTTPQGGAATADFYGYGYIAS